MSTYINEDGLEERYGQSRTEVAPDGVALAHEHLLVLDIPDATLLGDTDTGVPAGNRPFLPAGALIKDAYLNVTTAFTTSASGTLDLGFKNVAGTAADADGIDADIAVGAMTLDDVVICNGAQIGTKAAVDLYPIATYETGVFTAGAGKLTIKYVLDI